MASYNVFLIADPHRLAAAGRKGELKLDYMNYSLVPFTMALRNLSSSDLAVATAAPPNSLLPINVPRRPSKRSAAKPAKGSQRIGDWSPLTQGVATLNADIDVHDRIGQRFSVASPSDDVEVT
jgi:hypothetical protein